MQGPRATPLSIVLLALLFAAPGASALTVWSDPVGDVASATGNDGDTIDLVGLDVTETPADLRFTITVADMAAWYEDGQRRDYALSFDTGARGYVVEIRSSGAAVGFGYSVWATLYQQPVHGVGGRDAVVELPVDIDTAAGTITVAVPRHHLLHGNGGPPAAGATIANVRVTASEMEAPMLFDAGDAGPTRRSDDGGPGEFTLSLGAASDGDLTIAAPDPVRASNGAATTYLWRATINNTGELPHEVDLVLADVPGEWEARLPLGRLKVPANSTVDFPVLLTTPFTHSHGAITTFLVEARSTTPGHTGRIDLGIEYLATPQPAGHHDTLHFDAAPRVCPGCVAIGGGIGSWEFTMAAAPGGSIPDEGVPPTGSDFYGVGNELWWTFRLSEALRLGLDFDTAGTSTTTVTLTSSLPVTGAAVGLELYRLPLSRAYEFRIGADDPNTTLLATSRAMPPQDMEVDAPTTFQLDLVPTTAADLLAPAQGMTMVAILRAAVDQAGYADGNTVALNAFAPMALPLREYQDPIDEQFSAPDFLAIDVPKPERQVAPGTTLLYEIEIGNDAQHGIDLNATLLGEDLDWVSLPAGSRHTLPGNSTITIPVAVKVPESAQYGREIDFVFEAYDIDDGRTRGLVRLLATVADLPTAEAAAVDASEEVAAIEEAANKDSPGAALPFAAVGIAIAVARRRRTREQTA